LRARGAQRAAGDHALLDRHRRRRGRGVGAGGQGAVVNQTDLFVYGVGRSGSAVVRRARAEGMAVAFYDARAEGQDVDEALASGATRVTSVEEVDTARFTTCVAAPGVRVDHPDLQLLRERGVHVTGEVEWIWSRVGGRYVGITGTAGKGSTTLWLQDLLSR